jgi:hypothetical protein
VSAPYQMLCFQMSKYPTVYILGVHGTIYSSKWVRGHKLEMNGF